MTRLLEGLDAVLVSRREWGAGVAQEWPPELAEVRAIVIHHTATRNDEQDPLAMVARVERFHAHDRGWGDIGYSFIVLGDGRVVEGRQGSAGTEAPFGVVAGHSLSHNVGTIGIAVAGRFHDDEPEQRAWASLVALSTAIVGSCGLDPQAGPVDLANGRRLPGVICGHRDTADTSCPGDRLADQLARLRTEVAAQLVR